MIHGKMNKQVTSSQKGIVWKAHRIRYKFSQEDPSSLHMRDTYHSSHLLLILLGQEATAIYNLMKGLLPVFLAIFLQTIMFFIIQLQSQIQLSMHISTCVNISSKLKNCTNMRQIKILSVECPEIAVLALFIVIQLEES